MVGGATHTTLNFGSTGPRWSKNTNFEVEPIFFLFFMVFMVPCGLI